LKVRRGLEEFVEKLRAAYGDAEVYLFGSYARGDWMEDSDVDVIVVSKAFKGIDMPRRIGKVRNLAPKHIAFQILAYTPEEFQERLRRSVTLQDASTYWRRIA